MTYEIKYRDKEEMNDCGVEWIDSVPNDWVIKKLRYLADIDNGNKDTQDKIDDGMYPFYVRSDTVERINSFSYDGEAILTAGDGVGVGKVFHYVQGKFAFHQRVYKLSDFKNIFGKYLYYYIAENFHKEVMKLSAKSTVDSLRRPMFNNFVVVFPCLSGQQKISNFLDYKTSQFDSIIEKKEKLIEKLEEAKKSLISEIVTGKIKIVDGKLVKRDESEMKDSGVEWLGKIPKDWEVKKLKYISECYPSNVDKKTKESEKEVKLCNYTDVYYNDYINKDIEFMKATAKVSQIKKFQLQVGDIILTKDSESPDDIAVASYVSEEIDNLICGYHLNLIRNIEKNESMYVYFVLLSEGAKNYFGSIANGITRYGISSGGFKNFNVCLPRIDEQKIIIEYIEKQLENNNKIKKQVKNQINLIKQAKQSLISEAVTGKIDLRDWEVKEINN
jgi:type I restriction enzyme S subunit